MNITENEIKRCEELIPTGVVAILPGDHHFPVLKFGKHPDSGRDEVHIIARVTDQVTNQCGNQEVIVDLEDVKELTVIQ